MLNDNNHTIAINRDLFMCDNEVDSDVSVWPYDRLGHAHLINDPTGRMISVLIDRARCNNTVPNYGI